MVRHMAETYPCPKCGRTLRPSGEAVLEDGAASPVSVSVYQCDECLMTVEFLGETTQVALTFAVKPDGQPFDPAAPDGRLRF